MKRLFFILFLIIANSALAVPSLAPRTCGLLQPEVCIDQTPCKTIDGMNLCLSGAALPAGSLRINADCWEYQSTYTCEDEGSIDTCQPLRDAGCGQIGSSCLATDRNGKCVSSTFNFTCPDKPASTKNETVCDSSFCQGGVGCFDTTYPTDKDFGQAAAMVEVSRQAGVYGVDADKIEIFKGYHEECSIKVLGGTELKSCCKSAGGGGAYTNHAVVMTGLKAAGAVAGAAGKGAIKAGSKYMYDSLYGATDSVLFDKGLASMSDYASGLSSGTSFGAYGFTFSFSMDAGFAFTGFDPYSFAISIAINMVMEWLSCTPDEQTLTMKKGQNLCTYVGSYCSQRVPIIGTCMEIKQQQCCFNSILAKTVNRQGRSQLGMPSDQCGGFNQSQIQRLDFSVMDFSEFIASIMPELPNQKDTSDQINKTVLDKVKGYYD